MSNEELLPLLKDYLGAANKDRGYMKESLDEIKKTLEKTRECLHGISRQSVGMSKDAEAMKQMCATRTIACDKLHDTHQNRLDNIPSVEVSKIRDATITDFKKKLDKYPSAEDLKDMSKKVDRILHIAYGVAIAIGIFKWVIPIFVPYIMDWTK